jgi:hypothetical protein
MKLKKLNGKSKHDIGFIPKRHLTHSTKFNRMMSSEVENISREILLTMFSRCDQFLLENSEQKTHNLIISEVLVTTLQAFDSTELLPYGWKFGLEIQKAFLIRIFGVTVRKIADWQRESILKYSLVAFLELEKDNIFQDFKSECHSASEDSRVAHRFVNDILNSILITQVKVTVGSQIFDAVISTKKFNQKNSMLFYILKELVDLPMKKVVSYIRNYELYLKTWIEEQTVDFCVANNFLEKLIEDKMLSCLQLVKQILENMEDSTYHESSEWWSFLSQQLKFNRFLIQVKKIYF